LPQSAAEFLRTGPRKTGLLDLVTVDSL